MRNIEFLPNRIYAEHMHSGAIATFVLMTVAEQGLYDYECDPNSGVLRITAKAEFTRDELNYLCTLSPNAKSRKSGAAILIQLIVANAVARAGLSK